VDGQGNDGPPEGASGQRQPAALPGSGGEADWPAVERVLGAVRLPWDPLILGWLARGTSRPADLVAEINAGPGEEKIRRPVLLRILRRMTVQEMVTRQQVAGGTPETHYELTPYGRAVWEELEKLDRHGGTGLTRQADNPSPPGIDTTVAHPARIWDYWLGGKDNFAADRAAADAAAAQMPYLPEVARAVRAFQESAVRYLAGQGVRQFLDIGTGMPGARSAHEVAQEIAPESRVVYADNDPLVLVHAQALLTSSPQGACAYIEADLRQPGRILAGAAKTLDLDQPVAVILAAVLHFLPDGDDPWDIVRRLVAGLTGEAYLVIAHGTDDLGDDAAAMARAYNGKSAVPIWLRRRDQVARFFDGLDLLGPGLVPLGRWQGQEPDPVAGDMACYVGIGHRQARAAGTGTARGPRPR
jgi:DNA-binding HxlR family transcriptional regulator